MGYRNLSSYVRKVLTGLRALTVQFYTEANVKNGFQYFLDWYEGEPDLPPKD